MSVSCECCVLSGRGLCGADPSSRGFLPIVMCLLSVIPQPQQGDGLGTIRAVVLQKNKLSQFSVHICYHLKVSVKGARFSIHTSLHFAKLFS
jgi:hypothetical protein